MKNSSEKEKILKLLRSSLLNSDKHVSTTETHEEIFAPCNDDPVMVFAEKLSLDGGRFVYCQNEAELFINLSNLAAYRKWSGYNAYSSNLQTYLQANGLNSTLADPTVNVGISLCQGIVAPTGSIIITSAQGAGTTLVHFPQIMIVIAMASQIYTSYKQILNMLPETPPEWVLSIKSGKLIEEEIKELYIFVVDE
ncbi:MAG: LUD domain-containing protein [Bacteroidales bacterium]|nr:LUD domain-containing protein [Bacteroidales bacterium]